MKNANLRINGNYRFKVADKISHYILYFAILNFAMLILQFALSFYSIGGGIRS
jgi:hypothetical protein